MTLLISMTESGEEPVIPFEVERGRENFLLINDRMGLGPRSGVGAKIDAGHRASSATKDRSKWAGRSRLEKGTTDSKLWKARFFAFATGHTKPGARPCVP